MKSEMIQSKETITLNDWNLLLEEMASQTTVFVNSIARGVWGKPNQSFPKDSPPKFHVDQLHLVKINLDRLIRTHEQHMDPFEPGTSFQRIDINKALDVTRRAYRNRNDILRC